MHSQKNIKTLVSALALAAVAGTAAAQVDGSIIQPQSASTSYIELFGSSFGAGNLVDQSGLSASYVSGVTDFDSFVASTQHTENNADSLVCNSNGQNQPNGVVDLGETITFDLGAAQPIDAIAFWSSAIGAASSQAITAFELYADDDDDFTNGGTTLLGVYAPDITADGRGFAFNPMDTQFVHVVVTGHGGSDFVFAGEFAFRYSQPLVTNATQGTMHLTLQAALDNANTGDAIEIAAGTLLEDNIQFPAGLDVTITGAGMDQTFIDGGNDDNDRVMLINNGQTSATVVRDLSLTNVGSAAVRIAAATPVLQSVQFLNCSGVSPVDVNDSALFDGCVFTGTTNSFESVYTRGGSPRFNQCLFYNNSTFVDVTRDTSTGATRVTNCTFHDGGSHGSFNARNGAIIDVISSIMTDGFFLIQGSGVVNTSHCLYPGAPASNGNISGSPTFVEAAGGDYRLAPGSLGIDAADYDAYIAAGGEAYDLAGDWRRHDASVADTGAGAFTYLDMGAYESAALANDCNANGIDDAADLATKGAFTDFESAAGHAFTLNGTSPVMESGSVRLTEIGVQSQLASAIFDPQLDQTVANFRASFDAQFIYGTGWGADGISFALLDKSVHGTSALFGEDGPSTGALVVRISDYISQSIEIVHDGVSLGSVASPVDLNDGNWHHFEVEFVDGVVTVYMTPWGGQRQNLLSAFPSLTPFQALYGFGSRTGADTNEHRIDNVRFESIRNNDVNSNGRPDDCETLMACSPADVTTDGTANGMPDGAVTLSDFSYYLSLWSAADPAADITAEGACNLGTGEGAVTLSDFSCYLSTWSLGCP